MHGSGVTQVRAEDIRGGFSFRNPSCRLVVSLSTLRLKMAPGQMLNAVLKGAETQGLCGVTSVGTGVAVSAPMHVYRM